MYDVYVSAVSGKGDDRSAHFLVIHAGLIGLSIMPISMCKYYREVEVPISIVTIKQTVIDILSS